MNDQHWGPTISGDIVVTSGSSAATDLIASLLKRDSHLDITLIEPCAGHSYRSAWFLNATLRPWFYWNGMLKGREWLTRLSKVD